MLVEDQLKQTLAEERQAAAQRAEMIEAGLGEYSMLKKFLLTDTLVLGASGAVLLYPLLGPEASQAFGGGAACGLVYVALLQREIDAIGQAPVGGVAARLANVATGARLVLPVLLVAILSLHSPTALPSAELLSPAAVERKPAAVAPPSRPASSSPECEALLLSSSLGTGDGDLARARTCVLEAIQAAAADDTGSELGAQVPLPTFASGFAGFFAWKLPLRRRAKEWAMMELR